MTLKKENYQAAYFLTLQKALSKEKITHPVLIIDRDILNANIATLLHDLPKGMAHRLVAKSLPSPKLLAHICKNTGTQKLMTFNLAMLLDIAIAMPKMHQLLGKPLPSTAARQFYKKIGKLDTSHRVDWLIDTTKRLEQYEQFAKEDGLNLAITLELDIGLHRGGFGPSNELYKALMQIKSSSALTFTGFMGYEPHIAKIPTFGGWQKRALNKAWAAYHTSIQLAESVFGLEYMASIRRNAAGSPTYKFYKDTQTANEISIGSALIKPSDFDSNLLSAYHPAVFIAAPIIKSLGKTKTPALELLDPIKQLLFPQYRNTYFIHGGYWMARPIYPPELSFNTTYGRSSNQEILNGKNNGITEVGDFVFFRPKQSEAVLFQFGDIAIYENEKIIDFWPTFNIST